MAQTDVPERPLLQQRICLMDLPPELHVDIASFLTYPDALALKHSCRHFYRLVYTGVHLKVDWLVERFERKLECPMEKCSFRTDESFCKGRIRRIMERRRWHLECRRVRGGCWVVEGRTCRTDLVPSWLKRHGPRRVAKTLKVWGREALIIAFIAVMLELVWRLAQSLDFGQSGGLMGESVSNMINNAGEIATRPPYPRQEST